jgi:hypothetical protein
MLHRRTAEVRTCDKYQDLQKKAVLKSFVLSVRPPSMLSVYFLVKFLF